MSVSKEPRCPDCGELCTYDEVDIGVGIQRGNVRCDSCGWMPEQDTDDYLEPVEDDYE